MGTFTHKSHARPLVGPTRDALPSGVAKSAPESAHKVTQALKKIRKTRSRSALGEFTENLGKPTPLQPSKSAILLESDIEIERSTELQTHKIDPQIR